MDSMTPLEDLLLSTAEGAGSLGQGLTKLLVPAEKFHPYPRIDERSLWEGLPHPLRERIISRADTLLAEPWPSLQASQYLDFRREGNRSRYEKHYFYRRKKLVALLLAECCEHRGRFLDAIADGVWLVCEESSWCIPAHVGRQQAGVGLPDNTEPIVDLFAAETAALLSWVHELIAPVLETVSPLIDSRIVREIRLRCLDPCLSRTDFHWMGFDGARVNNWNPWINSSWLTCALLAEERPEERIRSVAKSLQSIDRFLGPYPADGGCDEGPSYWSRAGASLFECLELLSFATGERFSPFHLQLVGEIGRYISRVHIAADRYVNFADAPAVVNPPGALIERYGRRIGDPELESFGRWLLAQNEDRLPDAGTSGSMGRVLAELFDVGAEDAGPRPKVPAAAPLPVASWLPVIEVMTARDKQRSVSGYFVAAKGGHNEESHNHNDVGSCVVYSDGLPLLVDVGVEVYSRKTFSPERYSIWTMQSRYHNLLPTFSGVMQAPGKEFAAGSASFEDDGKSATLSLDIAGAYPPEAGIRTWRRSIRLVRGEGVEVSDRFESDGQRLEIELGVITPCIPDGKGNGRIALRGGELAHGERSAEGTIEYDATQFEWQSETIEIEDERLCSVWGARLFRIGFSLKEAAPKGAWRFFIR